MHPSICMTPGFRFNSDTPASAATVFPRPALYPRFYNASGSPSDDSGAGSDAEEEGENETDSDGGKEPPQVVPKLYGSRGGRVLTAEVLAAAPAACAAVGRAARGGQRVPWCRRFLRELVWEEQGVFRSVISVRFAAFLHTRPPSLVFICTYQFPARQLLSSDDCSCRPPLPLR